jgi:hypothetical protein
VLPKEEKHVANGSPAGGNTLLNVIGPDLLVKTHSLGLAMPRRWLISVTQESLVQKVEAELARYEHPLFSFSTQDVGSGVLLAIDLRETIGICHHYEITLQAREIENRQFPWTFQKLLYDCLHDFIVEMFERNPQEKIHRSESTSQSK